MKRQQETNMRRRDVDRDEEQAFEIAGHINATLGNLGCDHATGIRALVFALGNAIFLYAEDEDGGVDKQRLSGALRDTLDYLCRLTERYYLPDEEAPTSH
jgi:hypothetical protein